MFFFKCTLESMFLLGSILHQYRKYLYLRIDPPPPRYLWRIYIIHLADAFIQSDLQCIQAIHLYCQYVFPGNQTHNHCAANAMLYHWDTGTHGIRHSYSV